MTRYEWGVLITPAGLDPELESDFDGHGPRVADLRACVAIAQQAIAQGSTAIVRLTRDSGEGFEHERHDADFTIGQPAPLHWAFMPNAAIPQRYVGAWNRYGSGIAS